MSSLNQISKLPNRYNRNMRNSIKYSLQLIENFMLNPKKFETLFYLKSFTR